MAEETVSSKKQIFGVIFKIIRYVLAAGAGAAIGYGAKELDIKDQEAVESVKTAVTNTIKGEDLTDKQKTSLDAATKSITKEVVDKQTKKK